MKNNPIVFFGTSDFAVPAMEALADRIVAVVTQPDRPSGRGFKLTPTPVKRRALELEMHVLTPGKARDPEFVELVRAFEPSYLLVAAYGQILSTKLLETSDHGGINLHGSILPQYRGAAPIQRCIFDGHSLTGVTLMQMDKGMDTGDIIDLRTTQIEPDETYGELHGRLAQIAAKLAIEWDARLAAGAYRRTPQDGALASHAPKVDRAETQLHFEESAQQSYRRFRAFTPSPGIFVETRLGRVRIHEARICDLPTLPNSSETNPTPRPGTVLSLKPLTLSFSQGAIEFRTVQLENKQRQAGADWANGVRLSVGDSLSKEPEPATK